MADGLVKLKELVRDYSACDISDCLLKLKVPGAGFLPDILPLPTSTTQQALQPPIAAPISTILFVPKAHSQTATDSNASSTTAAAEGNSYPPSNIPPQTHWTDLPRPGTIAVIQQPPGQSCAVVGDILATRLKVRGVKGIVVDGRVRDLASLRELVSAPGSASSDSSSAAAPGAPASGAGGDPGCFCVWNKDTSTVGSGLEAKAWAADVPLAIGGVVVKPGDVLFADAEERGVVVIPHDKLDALLEMLPAVKAADDAVVEEVKAGVTVQEAFKKHRGT